MPRPQVVAQPIASQQIAYGVNMIADMLAATLGPRSGHVAHSSDSKRLELLDDSSVAVRRIITLGSPQRDIGTMMMRSLVWRVGQRIGDGGATAAVLARALFNEGVRLVTAGANAMQLAHGVRLGLEIALDELNQQAQPIRDENQLAALALNITNHRPLAATIAELVYLLGPDANVSIDKLVAPYLERRYIAGANYKAEISSMYFYSDPAKRSALLVSPMLALVDDELKEAAQVIPLLEGALQAKSSGLVIIAKHLTGSALNLLVSNHQLPKEKKKLDIFVAKLSAIGDERAWAHSDIALMSGASILGNQYHRAPQSARLEDLGRAQRVEFADNKLILLANEGERAKIQDTVSTIQATLAEMPLNHDDRPKLIRRLSTLTGGVGELKIGANSQTEREMLYEQTQRALKVLGAAQRSGVVAGAGAALHHCATRLQKEAATKELGEDVRLGVRLLAKALSAPLEQILRNTKVPSTALYLQTIAEKGVPYTFDAISEQVVHAHTSGVLDVASITVGVLQSAVSGALMALTTDAIVYHKKPKESMEP